MIVQHIKNGNLILTQKSWFWLVLLVALLAVNFIGGGYAMATKPISSWGPNIYIQLPLLAVLGFILGRAFTRKSEFCFDSENETLNYFVQSMWSEEKGVIDISDIIEIVIQEGGTSDGGAPMERLAINCQNQTIPLSVTYTNTINFESIKKEIDEWLRKNRSAKQGNP